jgi:hypothetical protein
MYTVVHEGPSELGSHLVLPQPFLSAAQRNAALREWLVCSWNPAYCLTRRRTFEAIFGC